jgi:hypothetical protein
MSLGPSDVLTNIKAVKEYVKILEHTELDGPSGILQHLQVILNTSEEVTKSKVDKLQKKLSFKSF